MISIGNLKSGQLRKLFIVPNLALYKVWTFLKQGKDSFLNFKDWQVFEIRLDYLNAPGPLISVPMRFDPAPLPIPTALSAIAPVQLDQGTDLANRLRLSVSSVRMMPWRSSLPLCLLLTLPRRSALHCLALHSASCFMPPRCSPMSQAAGKRLLVRHKADAASPCLDPSHPPAKDCSRVPTSSSSPAVCTSPVPSLFNPSLASTLPPRAPPYPEAPRRPIHHRSRALLCHLTRAPPRLMCVAMKPMLWYPTGLV
jgi:hypothetical protein